MILVIFGVVASVLASSYTTGPIGRALSFGALGNPVPGIVFSLCLLLVFHYLTGSWQKWWKNVVFVVISTMAYFAAVWSAIFSSSWIKGDCGSWGPCDNELMLGFAIGGILGGAILSVVGIRILLKLGTLINSLIFTIISGFLGFLSVFVLGYFGSLGKNLPLLGLYLVWQTGMALAIWVSLSKYTNQNLNNNV